MQKVLTMENTGSLKVPPYVSEVFAMHATYEVEVLFPLARSGVILREYQRDYHPHHRLYTSTPSHDRIATVSTRLPIGPVFTISVAW